MYADEIPLEANDPVEYTRNHPGEALDKIKNLTAENKRLNDIFEQWQYRIDRDTNPGGCANCFHQEWKNKNKAQAKKKE